MCCVLTLFGSSTGLGCPYTLTDVSRVGQGWKKSCCSRENLYLSAHPEDHLRVAKISLVEHVWLRRPPVTLCFLKCQVLSKRHPVTKKEGLTT